MTGFAASTVCATCAAHYPAGEAPEVCRICADERQYVPPEGQRWLDPAEPRRARLQEVEPGLRRVLVEPKVGIGQVGYLVSTPAGAVLWDAPGWVDDEAVALVAEHGRVRAVATSHPHFYGAMAHWGEALDAPVWVAREDRDWITQPSDRIRWWSGEQELAGGLRLVRCGGHFPGSAVLHWPAGADGRGVLLTGDTVHVVPAGWVSFAYSFPNHLPLSAAEVEAIAAALAPLPHDRIYGAFGSVLTDSTAVLARCVARYLSRLAAPHPNA